MGKLLPPHPLNSHPPHLSPLTPPSPRHPSPQPPLPPHRLLVGLRVYQLRLAHASPVTLTHYQQLRQLALHFRCLAGRTAHHSNREREISGRIVQEKAKENKIEG